jgi:hypothetical protein
MVGLHLIFGSPQQPLAISCTEKINAGFTVANLFVPGMKKNPENLAVTKY